MGRLIVAVILRLWPRAAAAVDVADDVFVALSASWWSEVTGTGTGTPAKLKRRRCPSGRSFRLGARGRCRPRARPPICGSSKVAVRHRYRAMSYTRRATHGPNVTIARNSCQYVSGGRSTVVAAWDRHWQRTNILMIHNSTVCSDSGSNEKRPIVLVRSARELSGSLKYGCLLSRHVLRTGVKVSSSGGRASAGGKLG